ncbi:hypothetical protein RclHR1_05630009 [Rhizophagus clarus]|uniref:Ricin B lectin domain-containing protein n=1 Tax=Rhizophagus clarus TaxID=94130 RepID=A0A2Z6S6P6_9GLOM|nr:hypothetical protein RclHR1_05630009 [Rhizophagus clarus]GES76111.1 hypothetical protein GLOIN_2v1617467 [Rhizophagus clarus]
MRLNFLLLLLIVFTAVALSQELPCRVEIQSLNPPLPIPPRIALFLTSDSKNNVILSLQGRNWTTVPCASALCPEGGSSIDSVHGESVQFNGLNQPLTIAKTRKDSSQCWHFQGNANSVSIISCKNKNAIATGVGVGLKVLARVRLLGSRQQWAFHKTL